MTQPCPARPGRAGAGAMRQIRQRLSPAENFLLKNPRLWNSIWLRNVQNLHK
ncbi:hypothetical protein U713_10595 [Rhodobacter capsulatus YW2]|nr:hypothetical protein U713_10595 [Rhodobacter capsulatus YW2]